MVTQDIEGIRDIVKNCPAAAAKSIHEQQMGHTLSDVSGKQEKARKTQGDAQKDWIHGIENDPDEQERLKVLADVFKEYVRDELKDTKAIVEVVCLAPVLEKEDFRFLLIKVLELLSARLANTHLQSTTYIYQLTPAISHVLDAMADSKVNGLNRERLHTPLGSYLDKLKGSSNPYLVYQATHAYRVLQYAFMFVYRIRTMGITGARWNSEGGVYAPSWDHSLIMASIDLMVTSWEKEPSWHQTVGGMDCPGFFSMDNGCSHRHALTSTVRQRRTLLDFQQKAIKICPIKMPPFTWHKIDLRAFSRPKEIILWNCTAPPCHPNDSCREEERQKTRMGDIYPAVEYDRHTRAQ
ncbi:MAG: hypothetical protein J3Q66DRAFT_407267 [Benniella sp.]|nr:MAG: hypothetical protein J3Q66DRAFT_407267 [Benniella sp.]